MEDIAQVNTWDEARVAAWLRSANFAHLEETFTLNDITGTVLLELDNTLLKELQIATVGERVRLLMAVRALRRSYASEMRRKHIATAGYDEAHVGLGGGMGGGDASVGAGPGHASVHGSIRTTKTRASAAPSRLAHPHLPIRDSVTGDAVSMSGVPPPTPGGGGTRSDPQVVRQHIIRVSEPGGQASAVNIQYAHTAEEILGAILHKFHPEEADPRSFSLFLPSSSRGALSDEDVVRICKTPGQMEKYKLILRRTYEGPRGEDPRRKGKSKKGERLLHDAASHPMPGVEGGDGDGEGDGGRAPDPRRLTLAAANRKSNFHGERPESELIGQNLETYFPGNDQRQLAQAGDAIKRRTVLLSKGATAEDLRKLAAPSSTGKEGRSTALRKLMGESASTDSIEETLLEDGEGEGEETKEEGGEEGEEEEEEKKVDLPFIPPIPVIAPIKKWIKGALIGTGSFGNVYLGLNPANGELLAAKQVEMPADEGGEEGEEESKGATHKRSMLVALQREISFLEEMYHENIVRYLGSQMAEGFLNIFLEYVPGGSVSSMLASYGAFEESLVRSYIRQALAGLSYLHDREIIHRDIKGGNILVDNKGVIKITDFGISQKAADGPGLGDERKGGMARASLAGSVFWMAPEVVKKQHYTRKADVWSLGCLVVEMFTGDHPYPEANQMQAIFRIGSDACPDIPEHIEAEAQDFLQQTFILDYAARPTAGELLKHAFLEARE